MTCTRLKWRFPLVRLIAFFLVVALAGATLHAEDAAVVTVSYVPAPIHVRHLLGWEGLHKKVGGNLTLEGDTLRFHIKGESAPVILNVAAIQNVEIGSESRQVGGVPMALGKAAVPYEGGRLVSLVSRKKFDTLTLSYTDSTGGLHGTIFELGKGKAETLRSELLAKGVHSESATTLSENDRAERLLSSTLKSGRCCVQVEPVEIAGDLRVEPAFRIAIYENLLREVSKSNVFSGVYRSGDRNATGVSDLLILKTTVSKYSPGSETLRNLTTFGGATKITLHMQVFTQSGALLVDREVSGSVRFFGDNMKATNHLAHNVAKSIKHDVAAPGSK